MGHLLPAALLALAGAAPAPASEILLETESFDDPGGWVVDQQFVDLMGSPYLLAHGMGVPVADASTTAAVPAPGTYRVWVRTKDWVPGYAGPGTFRVRVDGTPLAPTFGDADPAWAWQDGGTVELSAATVAVALEDQTGFAARCDAVYFTTDLEASPPNDPAAMAPWRRALLGLPDTPPVEGDFDLVVAGGGIAGCSAALAAARLGLSVALIHDRPFLGGNASQEVRVHTLGETDRIVDEIDTAHYENGDAQAATYDVRRHTVVGNEPNIALYLRWQAYGVEMSAGRVAAVLARHTGTGQERRFRAPFVVDSTGDGWIGFWAGASYRTGREASSEYGESLAPAAADNLKMGTSLLWNSVDAGAPQAFPAVPWALDVAKDYKATAGEWFWEYGIHPALDTIADAEAIRDHLFRAIYGSFWNAKQDAANANRRLLWVGYVGGKRESRRILGDHVLVEDDVRNPPGFPDGIVHESREIDLHFQQAGAYDFLSTASYTAHGQFWIPFRCLYSKDVPNLMMAGRCFSASHVGLGSPRVMRTCGQMGVAVGSAAYVGQVFGLDPRGICQERLDELKAVVEEGADGTLLRQEICIVDNTDVPPADIVGTWTSSTYEPGYWGVDYLHDGDTGKGTKSIRYTPTIPEAGTYQVYFRYTSSANRATNVPIDVTHAGGTETVFVDETTNGSQWVLIGAWEFEAGTAGNILVRTTGTTSYVSADAVRIARATVHPPCILPAAGSYAGSASVRLSCFTLGAAIRYTLDGSDPDGTSPLYAAPLEFLRSATVKARAWKTGCEPSDVVSADFVITSALVDVPIQAGYTLFALPLEPESPMKASGLIAALGDSGIACSRVLRFTGSGYDVYTSSGVGADFDVTPGTGYFVRCAGAGTWHMTGLRFDRASAPVGLVAGYNLVGLPVEPEPADRYAASGAIAEIGAEGGEATRVLRFTGAGYDVYTSEGVGLDFPLRLGEGYFLRCSKPSTWMVLRGGGGAPGGAVGGLPAEPVAAAQVVTLDGSTLVPPPGLAIGQILWFWGDGSFSTSGPAGPVSHAYAAPGRYTIMITVAYGDSSTYSWSVEVVVFDPAAPEVEETARTIPLVRTVDVVVVGGSTGAVAAAVSARDAGASVFVAAPRPYLGEDLCGPLLTWLEAGETPSSLLATQLFSTSPAPPLHLKGVLDGALEGAGAPFLTGSCVTDVLRDGSGGLAGIVIANRTGRQAVAAKVIVDATDRAWVARMAGAAFAPYPAGPQPFTRVVIGGAARSGAGIVAETMPFQIETRPVYRYTLAIGMADGSWRSFALAEQTARDMTWDPGQADDSDTLFQVPPDPMAARATVAGPWPGAGSVDLDAFRPAGIDRLYVVGGCAAVSREAAAAMLRPIELIEIGTRVGAAAAAEVADLPALADVRLPGGASLPARFGDAKEALAGSRPTDPGTPSLPAEARGIPVLGEFDVVVIGGGTGGAPAGIGAGRAGARTLLLESLHGLGGISTLGLIGSYYYGYREGFTKELDQGLAAMAAAVPVVGKSEWYRQQNRAAGTEVWYGALGCGAFVRGADVRGVVVATPQGRGVVLAKVVVDSTGNADVAAAAGAACSTTGGEHVGVQGAGLPPLALGASYTNTDFTFIDDTDTTDLWHAFFWAREKFAGSYDLVQITDTRERRRIVGDFTMTPMDILNGRRYPDTVVCAYSNFDSHGFTVHPYFLLTPPDSTGIYVDVPYRCLLPEGLDGILVTGLGASAHRDAMPVIRMQPDVQNQGYAAGLAAATAAAAGIGPRGVDVRALQQALVTKGNLPSRVLTDVDSYPYPAAQIQKAVDALTASPGILVDDADPAPAFQITGTWITSTSTSGYYGTGYKHNNQDPASTATFTPDLPAAGRYSVYLRWTANANRETAVPVTVQYSGGTAGLTVDQTANGGTWNLLGTWDFAAGTAGSVVLAAADGVGYVIADAVRFAPPTEVLVDDADPAPAFQTTGTWVTSTSTAGYYGAGYKHNDQDPASTATFTPDLPAAGSYDVYLRWTASTNRETAVPVTVHYDGGSASLTVNQTANGGTWNLLGTWSFAAGAAGSVVLAAADGVGYVIADAVRFVSQGAATMDPPAALAVVLTDPATAIPLLQAKHDDAGTHPDGRLAAAHILGMLGDATGAATLAAKVASYPAWDAGWDYTGMGQYGRSLSELDSYVIALGRTQAAGTALAPLLDKLALLDAAQAFSHHRAVAMALEALGDPSAAAPLAALLAKPAMTGYHVTSMAEARAQYGASATETVPRNNSLRELHIARALYRCGDSGGAGAAILALYAQDLRGHYSRHARAVLAGN